MDGPVQINLFAVFVVVAAIATTLLVFAARWFKPPPRKRGAAAPQAKPEADFDLEGSLKKSSDGMANGDRPVPADMKASGPGTGSPAPAPARNAPEPPPEDPKATSVFSKRKLGGVIVPPRRTGARSHVPEDAGPDGGPPRSAAPAAGTAAPPPASPAPQPEPQASAPETLAPPEDVAEITAPDTEIDFKITDRDSSVFSSPMGGAPVAPFPESQSDDGEAAIEDATPETVPPTDPAATEAEAPAPEKNDVFGSIFRDSEPPAEPMASDDFVDDTPPESPPEYTDSDLSDFDDDDPEIAAPIVEAHDHAPPEPFACEEEVEAPEPSVFEHADSEPEGLPHVEFSDIEPDLPETPPAPEPEAEIDPLDELIVPPVEPEPEQVAFAEPPEIEPEPEPESGPEPAPEPGPASDYVPPILAPQPPPAPKSEPEPAAAAPEPSLTMPPPPSAPINDEPVAAAPAAPPPPDAPILNDGDTDEADDAFENQLSRMRDNGAAPKASTTIPGFPVQAAEPEAEPVDVKAFSPMSVSPREPFIIQAVFHPEGEGQEAVQVASLVDPTASQRASRSLSQLVRPGQTLTATLEVDGAEIDAPVQSLLWEGKTEGLQFLVELPEQFERMSALAKLRILIDGVSVGSTAWRIVVQQGAKSDDPASQSTHVPTQYRKAFVSYSSKDRAEVLKRVQGLQAAGIEVFQDVLDLEPGDRWARELYRHIDESDAFYLFWSPDSAKSEWVAREWRYALDRAMTHPEKRPDICPVILTAPPPAPPQELADKHFNDIIAYVLAAIQQQG